MAEERSNQAFARLLRVTEKTVETHIAAIFSKLDLLPEPDDHRRVLAVRAWKNVEREDAANAATRAWKGPGETS
jgi:DNA-binding NarL/FixJ family response regulator